MKIGKVEKSGGMRQTRDGNLTNNMSWGLRPAILVIYMLCRYNRIMCVYLMYIVYWFSPRGDDALFWLDEGRNYTWTGQ